ncbi:hypothetical protein [Roseitranquillus sediminis]|uniref:hypothetical protein n=1 Tax=Roseitranquillus sediminis TaxID=2809051 RepID=UPI001D0C4C60|nr:hypothetical protein [Roseitranquillus sediminis]MBM9594380.1 hypothetical protein [Roseitranquillus sediminis]
MTQAEDDALRDLIAAIADELARLASTTHQIGERIGDLTRSGVVTRGAAVDLQEVDRLHQTLCDLGAILRGVADGNLRDRNLQGLERHARMKSVASRLASQPVADADSGELTLF